MTDIAASEVKKLRELTGAGMMDCKRALQETAGDIDKAVELLKEKGLASAAKRADRAADQGLIDSYIHFNHTVGVLVEVNSETDFVAHTDEFKQLEGRRPAHREPGVAALAQERRRARRRRRGTGAVSRAQAKEAGKPENVIEKIVEGKIDSFYEDNVLLEQSFVKDDSKTIQQLLDEVGAKVGEKVAVRRFVRYKLGSPTRADASTRGSTRRP